MMPVPACERCNRFFGQADNDGRILALIHEPNDPLTETLQKRVLDSLDLSRAKSDRDRQARERLRERMTHGLIVLPEGEEARAIWATQPPELVDILGPDRTPRGRGRTAFTLPEFLQPTLIGKWIRGSYYHLRDELLPPYTPWDWSVPSADGDPRELIREFAETAHSVFSRPEFKVWGLVFPSDATTSMWMFVLWDKMVFSGRTGGARRGGRRDGRLGWRPFSELRAHLVRATGIEGAPATSHPPTVPDRRPRR
jgi:hypothetical protein